MLYKVLFTLLSLSFLSLQASQTLYEDAENNNTQNWSIYDNTPAEAKIENIFDVQKQSHVIHLNGTGTANGYRIGNWENHADAWNNSNEKKLSLQLRFQGFYAFFVILETTEGRRYLYYSSLANSRGKLGTQYIHIGLGTEHMDDVWYTQKRDLETDLHQVEPQNNIIAVHGILFRGQGNVDNIILYNDDFQAPPPTMTQTLYEDAEDNNTQGWSIYDNSPAGATITNVYDDTKNSHVISLNAQERGNGYMLGGWRNSATAWHNTTQKQLSFDMHFENGYGIYVLLSTDKGGRFLQYTARSSDLGNRGRGYIHHGLGNESQNGAWYHFERDLEADLQAYEADNSVIAIEALLIRGTGQLDDIALQNPNAQLNPDSFAALQHLIKTKGHRTNYICVGDSTRAASRHEGQYLFYETREALARYGVTSHLLSRAGHKASQLLDESISPTWRDVVATIPDDGTHTIVDISLGINDYWAGNAEMIEANLIQAIANIRAEKPQTHFVLTMPNRIYIPGEQARSDRQTDTLTQHYLNLEQRLQLPLNHVIQGVMPSYEATRYDWYRDDGFYVHMSREGQHLVAQYLLHNLIGL